MSLIATSYRYEIEGSNKKSLQKALSREESRIKVFSFLKTWLS